MSMRILVIEDHVLFSEGMKSALQKEEGIILVDNLERIDDLNFLIKSNHYDIALVDINLNKFSKGVDGFQLSTKLRDLDPNLQVVMLTGFDMPAYAQEAQRIGARGFVSKNTSTRELVQILNRIMEGHTWFPVLSDHDKRLTPSEENIVKLYCSGLSRKDVAQESHMSLSSLAVSLNRVYDKWGVRNYQEMVKEAVKLGYIAPKDLF